MAKCSYGEWKFKCDFDPGSRHCDRHGPAVRSGKAGKPQPTKSRGKASEWSKGLTVLPTAAARWAKVLSNAGKDTYAPGREWEAAEREVRLHTAMAGDPLAEWMLRLFGALSVEV